MYAPDLLKSFPDYVKNVYSYYVACIRMGLDKNQVKAKYNSKTKKIEIRILLPKVELTWDTGVSLGAGGKNFQEKWERLIGIIDDENMDCENTLNNWWEKSKLGKDPDIFFRMYENIKKHYPQIADSA